MQKRVTPIPPTWLTQARIAQGWPMSQIDALSPRSSQSVRRFSSALTPRVGEMARRFRPQPPDCGHLSHPSDDGPSIGHIGSGSNGFYTACATTP